MWWSLTSIVFLVLCLGEVDALTGHNCTTQRSRTGSYVAYQQKRQSQRYTTKCGLFGWKRCTRYRDYYTQESVTRVRTVYYTHEECCPNWRLDTNGTNCGIHESFPSVTFCQANIRVHASGKTKYVSWTEPTFSEPFDFDLRYNRTYPEPHGVFPWGDTVVKYLATSTNNEKQVKCEFTITVDPPSDKPEITGFVDGGTVHVQEHQQLILTCRAGYGRPPSLLKWYRGSIEVTTGTSFSTVPSDFRDYQHAINTLAFNPDRHDDNVTYECQATKPPSPFIRKFALKLNVSYEVMPVVTSCPESQSVTSTTRRALTTWSEPTFVDPMGNDQLSITSNVANDRMEKFFAWGVNTVIYTATNTRNKLQITCSFNVTVWPPDCNPGQLIPVHGALVCQFWPVSHTHLCQPVCHEDYDVSWVGEQTDVYVCGADGVWWPHIAPVNCTVRRWNNNHYGLFTEDRYFSGSCDGLPTQLSMRQQFTRSVRNSPYSDLCEDIPGGCGDPASAAIFCRMD